MSLRCLWLAVQYLNGDYGRLVCFLLGFGVFVDEDRDDHDDGNDVLAVVWLCLVFRCCQCGVFVVDVVDDVLHPCARSAMMLQRLAHCTRGIFDLFNSHVVSVGFL